MNQTHPTDSEWMLFLYDECSDDEEQMLEEHLASCNRCRQAVASWRRTIGRLDAWQLEETVPLPPAMVTPRRRMWTPNMLQVGIVLAAVVAAFLLGQHQAPDVNYEALAGRLTESLDVLVAAEVSRQLPESDFERSKLLPLIRTESGRAVEAQLTSLREDDSERYVHLQAVLRELLQHQATLRKDLQTLAVEAEGQILRTQQEIYRLESAAGIGRRVSQM